MKPTQNQTSYILAVLAVVYVLKFHLLGAVLAGLAVYSLVTKLARWMPKNKHAKVVSLTVVVMISVALVIFAGMGVSSALKHAESLDVVTAALLKVLETVKQMLPAQIGTYIPVQLDELKAAASATLKEKQGFLSEAGALTVESVIKVLMGVVIGSMVALHKFRSADGTIRTDLRRRAGNLRSAFDKIVFAQVKISAINTALTYAYLLVLQLAGYKLPAMATLVVLTFFAGLLPALGNVISNSVILLVSMVVSPVIVICSTVFLFAIHKLEYILNAKIVGNEVQASPWELLCAVMVMSASFGVAGLVAAPICYAWLKSEMFGTVTVLKGKAAA